MDEHGNKHIEKAFHLETMEVLLICSILCSSDIIAAVTIIS